ncbi:GH92 family glycosyl hydrolase [Bacteroides sp. 51]|uniref:GH92 family glycosyl hydrolase n=1 Tax=Bacteroides sp. 51 TaxID=2302938 RepID=UPI0013D4C306|nr:GH92 family glycosyl hydrolase [Bacteroides sp. 51]NDV81733.1 glycoside hydrolase family 92 protein [Bacteroides sp. 51]
MKLTHLLASGAIVLMLGACSGMQQQATTKTPVDYVNPYVGNISHLLVPTFPTIQLPNSMLRVYPERADYTTELLNGLPLIVTNHRERSAFNLSPYQGDNLRPVVTYTYDNERLTPYSYSANIEPTDTGNHMKVNYALSHQSALYHIAYGTDEPAYVIVNSRNGAIHVGVNFISGHQRLNDNTKVYLYIEPQEKPVAAGVLENGKIEISKDNAEGKNVCAAWRFADGTQSVSLRYGISFISEEQAEKNLRRELKDYNVQALADTGRRIWNETLGQIQVQGGTEEDKTVFYSSFYRTFERPICMSEDGHYFSAFDGKVHDDEGTPFYNDDWIWDTYRAAHPLRVLLDQKKEEEIITSFLRMAEQMGTMWMPTFPEVTGDSRRMNSNHGVATVADALIKGLKIDTLKAYEACRRGIEEKTLAPWSGAPAGWIDEFYLDHGYIPALQPGEKETDPNVHHFEKRQPVAVTLGTSYDQWCLSRIAEALGKPKEAAYYLECSRNYRNLFNPETAFFHPKDKDGRWIEPFDYRYSGGMGAREYYGENNGWVYRWDVPHNVADLINLMGGREAFISNLERTFREPLGRGKYEFYSTLPDHTGNVGQFSMANEPSLHIPYLYNYAGQPWNTQKHIRKMLKTWFRNDLMGMPGDEDGGGMTSFVVFSSLGFYPVTPGFPAYNIGSPLFTNAKITLSNGKVFEIEAQNASDENKYIQSATLNGQEWNKPWFSHDSLMEGGKLVLVMGDLPNKKWGSEAENAPPSVDKE